MADTKSTITPAELKKKLDSGNVQFLFDLRAEDEFESWRIEGRTPIDTLNLPQEDFVGEEDGHMDKFPKNKEIVTVCAHGDSSKYTAELLQERGFIALGLEGGMDAWSELYEVNKVSDAPEVWQILRVARGCISHVVISEGEAAVIDAVRHVQHIMKIVEQAGAKVKYVIDTHLQADHITGGTDIAGRTGAPYYIHSLDAAGATYKYVNPADAMELKLGSSTLRAVYTPGHTPGSTSWLLDDKFLFTGDIIMPTSVGRPDLGGMVESWAGLLFDTLFKRLAAFPDELVILPSHAASIKEQDEHGIIKTSMGIARAERELFQLKDQKAFSAKIRESLLENPERYQEIRKVNLGQIDPEENKRKELEIGKNLCGMSAAKK